MTTKQGLSSLRKLSITPKGVWEGSGRSDLSEEELADYFLCVNSIKVWPFRRRRILLRRKIGKA